jgi:hypothetical protein
VKAPPPERRVSEIDLLPLTTRPSAGKVIAGWWKKNSPYFSIVLIVVSLVSLGFNWKSNKLAEATSRAVVEPTSLAIVAAWRWNQTPGAAQEPIKIEMAVLNAGKLLATSLRIQFWPNLFNVVPQVDTGAGDYPSGKSYAKIGRVISEDDLGPGMPRVYKVDIDVNPEPAQKLDLAYLGQVNAIRFQPNFFYNDANGEHHEQPCFEAYASPAGTFMPGPVSPCNMFDRRPLTNP